MGGVVEADHERRGRERANLEAVAHAREREPEQVRVLLVVRPTAELEVAGPERGDALELRAPAQQPGLAVRDPPGLQPENGRERTTRQPWMNRSANVQARAGEGSGLWPCVRP